MALPLLGAGLLFGILRSFDTRIYFRDQRLVGRRSAWFLVGWGVSVLIVQLLSLIGERALLAVGLIPFYFTTGAQIGMNCSLYLRRRRVSRPSDHLPETYPGGAFSQLPEFPEGS